METNITQTVVMDEVAADTAGIFQQLSAYGDLFANGLYLIVVGCVLVFLLHRIAAKFIYARIQDKLMVRIGFGLLYVTVMVVAVLLAMERLGIDVGAISKVVFLVLLIFAVAIYFLAPFFPRLPFKLGDMIEANGVLGIVDSISNFHTILRKLDGTIVFIPNPLILSSKILNYSDSPMRRVEFSVSVNNDCDLEETKAVLVRLMQADERVLDEPSSPAVFVVNVTASGVDMMAFCWVKNGDWFSTRSDLWLTILATINAHDRIALSLPQQEAFVKQ